MLLLYDGHLTHISIPVIKAALEQDNVILKFPPHIIDVLQPLDVAWCGPLKRIWEAWLQKKSQWIQDQTLSHKFVTVISAIWKEGMKKENAIGGFKKKW